MTSRVVITQDPFLPHHRGKSWREQGLWPCSWVACLEAGAPPFVTAYRRRFSVERGANVRVHVAADERYDLYLDGAWIGRGNERGAPHLWFYETYQLTLTPGEHVLVARVWSLGEGAAEAQMSVQPGFLLAAEDEWTDVLGTGTSAWEAKRLEGCQFLPPGPAGWRGARVKIDGAAFSWGYEQGEGQGWQPVQSIEPAMGQLVDYHFHRQHLLRPATLPPLHNRPFHAGRARLVAAVDTLETSPIPVRAADHLQTEEPAWTALLNGRGPLQVPAHTTRRVIFDLENYYTVFPQLTTTGGAGSLLRLHWAEALFEGTGEPLRLIPKGNRSEIEGKHFFGYGDTFLPDGGSGRRFEPLWWMAGRYLELLVQTGDQPLTIDSLALYETRYPLEMESEFSASDERLARVIPLMVRGMQMCANETYFDCPYYEELQYAGDTRLEILTTYVMTRDDRLPKKAVRMFNASRLPNGLTQSRYPSRVMQIIPPFALWWVMMVRDYALWRGGDLDFLRSLMPGVRSTLEGFQRYIGAGGLLYGPEGWNFMDWVPEWSQDAGVPPDGHTGASGLINWHLIYTLTLAADLEDRLEEGLMAEHFRRQARSLAQAANRAFWDEGRGLLADDRARAHFSEHTQCLALLADGMLPGLQEPARRQRIADGLLSAPDLARATIYFSHYLFETYRELGLVDRLLERMQLWFGLVDQGFKTPVESPEPSRSDCHGWGAHPLYHYFATLLGIRPGGLGFRSVEITPQPGPLDCLEGRLVHPGGGEIAVSLRRQDGKLHGTVTLPGGLHGVLKLDGQSLDLGEGATSF